MTLYETKAGMVVRFVHLSMADGLFLKLPVEKQESFRGFVAAYGESTSPNDEMKMYHLKVAPLEKVYARTHVMAKAQISLLVNWSVLAENTTEVMADSGPLVLGDGEADDLDRLHLCHAAFVKHHGAAGLPPRLKADEIKKQNAAHLKARSEMPVLPAGQQRLALNAGKRDLSGDCDIAFDDYHAFLDFWIKGTGVAAFKKKAAYGYDRRAGKYRTGGKAAATEGAPAGEAMPGAGTPEGTPTK